MTLVINGREQYMLEVMKALMDNVLGHSTYRATSVASPSVLANLNPGVDYRVLEIRVSLSAVGGVAENFTVTLDSATNPVYDNVLFSQDMVATQYVRWVADTEECRFSTGDQLVFAYANTNARTVSIEVIYRTIS